MGFGWLVGIFGVAWFYFTVVLCYGLVFVVGGVCLLLGFGFHWFVVLVCCVGLYVVGWLLMLILGGLFAVCLPMLGIVISVSLFTFGGFRLYWLLLRLCRVWLVTGVVVGVRFGCW